MLHYAVEAAFDNLLTTWRAHQDIVKRKSTTVQQRASARIALDDARRRMHRLRIAMYPEPDEIELIMDSIWCEVLDSVVHFRWTDRDDRYPGNVRCACGNLVPIEWDTTGSDPRT